MKSGDAMKAGGNAMMAKPKQSVWQIAAAPAARPGRRAAIAGHGRAHHGTVANDAIRTLEGPGKEDDEGDRHQPVAGG